MKRFYTSLRVNAKNEYAQGIWSQCQVYLIIICVSYLRTIFEITFWDILQETKSGFGNTYIFKNLDLYKNNKIDYKILPPSALHYIKNGRMGSVFLFCFRVYIKSI